MARPHGLARPLAALALVLAAACGDVHSGDDTPTTDAAPDAPPLVDAPTRASHGGDIRTAAGHLSGGRFRMVAEVGAAWNAGPAVGGGMRLVGGGAVTQ